MTVKVLIARYDETIDEPPYKTIPIDETIVEEVIPDPYGEKFYDNLVKACKDKGYKFKFYTLCRNGEHYFEAVVN
jgi:hypothetical protein